MKKCIYLIWAILIILPTACRVNGNMLMPTNTLVPISTKTAETKLPVSSTPTETKLPEITTTPTLTITPTSVPAIPSEAQLVYQCLKVESATSSNKISSNGIVIYENNFTYNDGYRGIDNFRQDMSTMQVAKLESHGYNHIFSPDGKFMAYKHSTFDANGKVTGTELVISTSEEGQIIIPWEKEWGMMPEWLNNQNIAIEIIQSNNQDDSGIESAGLLVLNPFNAERLILQPNFVDFYNAKRNPVNYWDGWNGVVYNPMLTYAVYSRLHNDNDEKYTYGIWDLTQQQFVASLEEYFAPFTIHSDNFPRPRWAPDGSQFVFRGLAEKLDRVEFELYLVNSSGLVDQITHLTSIALVQESNLSWSPDGRYIAMFLNDWGKNIYKTKAHVAVIDTITNTIRDFCIETASGDSELIGGEPPRPIWSPDSKQFLAVDLYGEENKRVILIDIEVGIAIQIAEGMEPVGWMVEPER